MRLQCRLSDGRRISHEGSGRRTRVIGTVPYVGGIHEGRAAQRLQHCEKVLEHSLLQDRHFCLLSALNQIRPL